MTHTHAPRRQQRERHYEIARQIYRGASVTAVAEVFKRPQRYVRSTWTGFIKAHVPDVWERTKHLPQDERLDAQRQMFEFPSPTYRSLSR